MKHYDEGAYRGVIREMLPRSGLVNCTPQSIKFYVAAYEAGELYADKIRKRGEPLTKARKSAMGITYRGLLSSEYIATLSEDGRRDPVASEWLIAGPIVHACANVRDLQKLSQLGVLGEFVGSNMAKGPCARARAYHGEAFDPDVAPVPPFEVCTHPDQCACMYRAALD